MPYCTLFEMLKALELGGWDVFSYLQSKPYIIHIIGGILQKITSAIEEPSTHPRDACGNHKEQESDLLRTPSSKSNQARCQGEQDDVHVETTAPSIHQTTPIHLRRQHGWSTLHTYY